MGNKLPIVLTFEEREALKDIFNERYRSGRKNKLIVRLMLSTGIRISELCSLKWENINFKTRQMDIVNGKGKKDRNIFIPSSILATLEDYRIESPPSPYVFATRTGNKPDRSVLSKMITDYARKAGINKSISAHTLRHTCLTERYLSNKDIRTVQKIAGHKNLQTTMIYTHISDEIVKDALELEI